MAFGSPRGAAHASTCNVLQSSSALQISLAPQAPTAGSSAKVKPPFSGHLPVSSSSRGFARARIPSRIGRIAAQPLPHEGGTVELGQAAIWRGIAPVSCPLPVRRHENLTAGTCKCDNHVTQITLSPMRVLIGSLPGRNADRGGNEDPKRSRLKAERTARRVLAA